MNVVHLEVLLGRCSQRLLECTHIDLLTFIPCSPLPNLGWQLTLSGSFRFPPEIACVANAVLKEGMADTGFVFGVAPNTFPGGCLIVCVHST